MGELSKDYLIPRTLQRIKNVLLKAPNLQVDIGFKDHLTREIHLIFLTCSKTEFGMFKKGLQMKHARSS